MQDEADEVIDLTDDCETTFFSNLNLFHITLLITSCNSPTNLFVNIVPEWVEDLPQDIDGMKIYKIKCLPRELVQKRQDLRYSKTHSLNRKGLIGKMKVGRCIRNLYYPYDDCP